MLHGAGQSWLQLQELGLAFFLSALVGLERELRQKSAGLRTYTLVGVSAALFTLISKYGFGDVLAQGTVVLDPSRVAAQIVSGIGFIGGGVIFMRQDVVRGLTTAASVWLTAALGMACGAGLPVLAVATTIGHVAIMFVFPRLTRHLPKDNRTDHKLTIAYQDGRGLLRQILVAASRLNLAIDQVEVEREGEILAFAGEAQSLAEADSRAAPSTLPRRVVVLRARVSGTCPVNELIAALDQIDGIVSVSDMSPRGALD